MKTILSFIFILSSLASWAQSSSSPVTASETAVPTWRFDRIKENLKINYFAEILGPSVKKWDDNEVNSEGIKQREPVRTFHSFSTMYMLTDRFSFFLSPRFVTVIGDRNDIRPNDDHNVFQMDDWHIGFHNNFYKRRDLSYGQRLSHRQPFSTYSKNSLIDSQIEWTHDITWQPSAGWRVIHWNNYRYYIYEDRAGTERYRINFTTILNYDFNDKWRTQFMYEFDLQHRNPNNGPEERPWNYFKKYENHLSFGIGYNPTSKWSVIPFIRAMELADIRNENTIVGLWVLGKVL